MTLKIWHLASVIKSIKSLKSLPEFGESLPEFESLNRTEATMPF